MRFFIFLVFFICSCSSKMIYERDSVRIDGGKKRHKQMIRMTKKNLKDMNRLKRKLTKRKDTTKSIRKHRKYSKYYYFFD